MNFLRTLGLGDFLEKENLLPFLRWAGMHGKPLKGYSGEYCCVFLKDVSVILHIENSKGRRAFSGLSTSAAGGSIWTLRRTDEAPFRKDEEDRLVLWARFQGDDRRRRSIAVRILFADVLPYIAPGEEITMRVAAFALDVRYYPDADTWAEKEGAVLMGAPMQIAGSVLGKDDGISIIQGEIKKVTLRETLDFRGDPVLFYAVTVDTCYGELEIFHGTDMAGEEEKKFIRVGACIYASCVIQGDAATGNYAKGAVYDEENCLRLLEDAFATGSFKRAEGAFREDAEYVDGDLKKVRTKDREGTVKILSGIHDRAVKKEGRLYAYLGEAEKFYGSGDDDFAGKKILALAHTTPAYFREMLCVKLDSENKIASVTLKNISGYGIKIREERHLPVNEASCLALIKEALDGGDCSRLVNYLARDAVFTDMTGFKAEGSYEVLDALERFLYYQYESGFSLRIFTSRIVSGKLSGKECLAVSPGDFEDCTAVLTLDLREERIASISLLKNEYDLAAENAGKRLVPLVTERSPAEWLAFLRDWITGKETDPMAFYLGLEKDCAITVDDGKVINAARGREDVFKKMKELAKSAPDAGIKGSMLSAPSFSLTLTAGGPGRIKIIRVRLK